MTREQAIEEISYYCQDSEKIIKALDQETCKDSVSRKAILSKIKEVCFSDKWLQFRVNKGSHGQRDFIIDYIEKLAPVTPERKKAKWIKLYFGSMYDICSECGQRVTTGYFEYNYCPSCGAEMTAEENDK